MRLLRAVKAASCGANSQHDYYDVAEWHPRTFSASWSVSSFSRLRKSSRSSLSKPTTVGVCGLLSIIISPRRLSTNGLLGVAGLGVDGMDDTADPGAAPGAFLTSSVPALRLSGVAHLDCSTEPPDRHVPTSASSAAMYASKEALVDCAFLSSALSSAGDISTLTRAVFLIDLARIPNLNVDKVSGSLKDEGEQLIISVVRELPPSDSWRMRVNLESRYGMCVDYCDGRVS